MAKKVYKVGAVSKLLATDKSTFGKKLVDVFSNNPFKPKTSSLTELGPLDDKKKKIQKTKAAKSVGTSKNADVEKRIKRKKDKKCNQIKSKTVFPDSTGVDELPSDETVEKSTEVAKMKKIVLSQDDSAAVETKAVTNIIKKKNTQKRSKRAMNDDIIAAFDKEQGTSYPSDEDSDVDESTKLKDSKAERKSLKNFELNSPKEKKIEEESRTVFVGNLPPTISKKTVLKIFRNCGKVEAVRLRCGTPLKPYLLKKVAINCKKLNPNQTSLAAYVRFSTMDEAKKAMQDINGMEVEKHCVVVDTALPVKKDRKKSIFVGNVSNKTRDDELRKFFADCGEIESVRLIRDKCTGLAKGFGYVNFKDSSSVQSAIQKHGADFNGRELRVMKTVKKLKKPKGEKGSQPVPEQSGTKTQKFAKISSQPPYQRRFLSGAERRIENRQKFAFGGVEHAEGKSKNGYKKPNKTALRKANIASQLTGVSKTQVKKSIGQKERKKKA